MSSFMILEVKESKTFRVIFMAKNSTVIFINLISFIQWVFCFSSFAIVLISLQQDFETGLVIVKTHFFFLQFLDFVHHSYDYSLNWTPMSPCYNVSYYL